MGLLSRDQFHLKDLLNFFIKSLKPLFKNALGPAESRLLHCITNIMEKSSGKFERKKLKLSLVHIWRKNRCTFFSVINLEFLRCATLVIHHKSRFVISTRLGVDKVKPKGKTKIEKSEESGPWAEKMTNS